MNKQILKRLSAIALAVAMLQGVALTSAISYSAVETEQVEASDDSRVPIGTAVRWDVNLGKFVECEYRKCGDYTYYITDDGKGAVIAGELYVDGYASNWWGYRFKPRSGYLGNDEEVVIPSELDGLPVVELDRYAFCYNKNLCSIVIPSTVKTIGCIAFYYIDSSVKIQLPEGIEEISSEAFAGIYANKLVIPSSLKKVGKYAFGVEFDALVLPKNSQLDRNAEYSSTNYNYMVMNQNVFLRPQEINVHHNIDVLVPDDFDITSILLRNDSYIYYTEKNETIVECVNNASREDLLYRVFVKLELKDKNVNLKTNEEYELKSNLRQQSLIDCCTWQSSDTSVATVDEKGKVTAVGVGTATITMTTENEMQASCTVNVSKDELKITKPNLKVGLDQKYKLALNKTDVKGTWSSSDTSVVTVNKSGNVTAVGVGTAIITFTAETGATSTCLINVAESKISDLGLSLHKSMKGLGRDYSLTPKDIRISGCTWKSSDTKVVTVNQYGIVKTVGVGTANVTVTDKFGNKFTCKVKVGI